jgi:hypothetical protein
VLRPLKLLSYRTLKRLSDRTCTYAPPVSSAAPLPALHSVGCISRTAFKKQELVLLESLRAILLIFLSIRPKLGEHKTT